MEDINSIIIYQEKSYKIEVHILNTCINFKIYSRCIEQVYHQRKFFTLEAIPLESPGSVYNSTNWPRDSGSNTPAVFNMLKIWKTKGWL